MEHNKIKSTDWLSHNQSWEQSSLTQRDYCRSVNISFSQFKVNRSDLIKLGLLQKILGKRSRRTQLSKEKSLSPPGIHFNPISIGGNDKSDHSSAKPTPNSEVALQLPGHFQLTIRCYK